MVSVNHIPQTLYLFTVSVTDRMSYKRNYTVFTPFTGLFHILKYIYVYTILTQIFVYCIYLMHVYVYIQVFACVHMCMQVYMHMSAHTCESRRNFKYLSSGDNCLGFEAASLFY